MVCWGDENLSRWFYFWHLFNLFSVSTLPPPPPPADLYELSQEPSGTMQVVSLKKMRMRTTRRLEITDSRPEVEPLLLLGNCWTWVRGSVAAFRWPQFYIITNVYCEKSIVSDPLTIEDEVELTCQRSKFVLDSSSNEYEMSVGLSIS